MHMTIELFAEAQNEIANPQKKLDLVDPFEMFSKCSENSKNFVDNEEYSK
jgi:hypothetical protein